jgi:nicotinamide phosphoribosyltransferase
MRDTQATKACFVVDGEERNIIKSPTEMDADGNIVKSFKKSKQGKLKLVNMVTVILFIVDMIFIKIVFNV